MITWGFKNLKSNILKAAVAIVTGILLMWLKQDCFKYLVWVLGAALICLGLFALIPALRSKDKQEKGRTVGITNAVIDIVIGIALFFLAGIVAKFALIIIGVVISIIAIYHIVVLASAGKYIHGLWMFAGPAVVLVVGILLIVNPGKAGGAMIWIAGAGLVLLGILELVGYNRVSKALMNRACADSLEDEQAASGELPADEQ